MLDGDSRDHLRRALADRAAVLFTGAGFSADARDRDGRALPTARVMAEELRVLCFEDPDDDSTLPDLYDVAAAQLRGRLIEYLDRRLRVGDAPLPGHYGIWFAAPWARIYTLNVDDLDDAVARQLALPRPVRPISAVPARRGAPLPPPRSDVLEVIHLNGVVSADLDTVTFSTLQHATRLVERCPYYAALVDDLAARPFVFVGTGLDEALFWQHLQLRRDRERARPRSLLVTPRLSRARQQLLEGLNIEWIDATAAAFADGVLRALVSSPPPRREIR
jgi:hypothetical protein